MESLRRCFTTLTPSEACLRRSVYDCLVPSSSYTHGVVLILFQAEVTDGATFEKFKWEKPKHDDVVKYLVDEKQFDLERVTNALKRLEKSKEKTSQRRMDAFFKPVASSSAGFKRKKGAGKGKRKSLSCTIANLTPSVLIASKKSKK